MELLILAIGRRLPPALDELCDQWSRRVTGPWSLRRDVCRDKPTQWTRAQAHGGAVVFLDERGTQLDSRELAGWLTDLREHGRRRAAFLVGDAHGYDDDDRRRAERTLALSRLTLPHRLAQVLLVEQLYRAVTIVTGHPYHHD